MSKMIAALRKLAFVQTATSQSDRRTLEITPTGRAKRPLQGARRRRVAELSRRLVGFTESEIAVLESASALLEQIVRGP